jgi:hypothetical protein
MSPVETVRNGWSRRQLLAQEHIVHAIVVTFVVLCSTILRATGHLDNNTASIVFGTAIGYAAGRSGNRAPTQRRGDG